MRKSFQGLLALVQRVFTEDPYSGSLFVFVNRRGNYVKILAWDRTGFALYAKRLERGRFVFPNSSDQQELNEQALRFLLDGSLYIFHIAKTLRFCILHSNDTDRLKDGCFHWE